MGGHPRGGVPGVIAPQDLVPVLGERAAPEPSRSRCLLSSRTLRRVACTRERFGVRLRTLSCNPDGQESGEDWLRREVGIHERE